MFVSEVTGKTYTEREFQDDHEQLVMAIKKNEHDGLLKSFQEYWKERCDNNNYLPLFNVYKILADFAIVEFNRADWYFYQEKMNYHLFFSKDKTVSINDLVDFYLISINLMTMRYEL